MTDINFQSHTFGYTNGPKVKYITMIDVARILMGLADEMDPGKDKNKITLAARQILDKV